MKVIGELVGVIFALMAIVVALTSFFGPIVSGIWLAVMGEWALIGAGIAYMFLGVLFISIAIMPGMLLLAAPAAAASERGSLAGTVLLGLLALLWTSAVAVASCVLVLNVVVERIPYGENEIPYLLWAVSAAVAPWGFLASKDEQAARQSGEIAPASITAAFLTIGCLAAAVGYIWFDAESWQTWGIYIGCSLGVGFIVQLILAVERSRRPSVWY